MAAAEIEGYIGLYGLIDWWLTEFTPAEREYIEQNFRPMGFAADSRPLTQGQRSVMSGSAKMLLTNLSGWFRVETDSAIGWRILDQAARVPGDIVDEHFRIGAVLERAIREGRSGAAIRAAHDQVAIQGPVAVRFRREYPGKPLPHHAGYSHLVRVRARDGDMDGMTLLAQEARNEGWQGFDDSILNNICASIEHERRRDDSRSIRAQAKTRGISTKRCRMCRHPMLPEMRFCSNCGAAPR